MTAGAWLDVMPAIPLTRGVPVIYRDSARERGTVLTLHHGPGGWVCHDGGRHTAPIAEGLLGVDLEDDQGFSYALRYAMRLANRKSPAGPWRALVDGFTLDVRWRHLHGQTTDRDRVALATALAAVTS